MGYGRAGRTDFGSALVLPGVLTATGFDALDAFCTQFSATLAVGEPGGVVGSMLLFDGGSGAWPARFHFFSTAFSASPIGTAWRLATADIPNYLGYIEVEASDWVSAGVGMQVARVIDQNIPLESINGARMIWGQGQAVSNMSAFSAAAIGGNTGAAMWATLGVLQD